MTPAAAHREEHRRLEELGADTAELHQPARRLCEHYADLYALLLKYATGSAKHGPTSWGVVRCGVSPCPMVELREDLRR